MTTQIQHHQELSDEDVDRASIDDLRAAYRALRDHHVTETTALISRRDDLTRRRDEQLANSHEIIADSQKLIEQADAIMRNNEEVIDRLGSENARLSEIVEFMQKRYSPIGGRSCALCVYVDGRFVRPCTMHRFGHDQAATLCAERPADPTDPKTPDGLSDEELETWADANGIYEDAMKGTCLRMVVDELRERRDAEILFVELDRKFQDVVDCAACDDGGPDGCEDHKALIRSWRAARSALCDLARIHRGYLMSLNAPGGGDPR